MRPKALLLEDVHPDFLSRSALALIFGFAVVYPCRGQAASRRNLSRPARASTGKAGIQWVRIPGGTFMMGDTAFWEAKPLHAVAIKPFYMARTLVTNKQYKACVAARACAPAQDFGAAFDGDDQPVVGVDWNQAKAFSTWVGGRLPSEAEWEYAARSGGKNQQYPWGNKTAACASAVIGGCGLFRSATAPVCSKPAGNTRQGLCDMAGNAWEWVEDSYHDSYNGAPTAGGAWEGAGSARVDRGGSWRFGSEVARSAYRRRHAPGSRSNDVGFRLAR